MTSVQERAKAAAAMGKPFFSRREIVERLYRLVDELPKMGYPAVADAEVRADYGCIFQRAFGVPLGQSSAFERFCDLDPGEVSQIISANDRLAGQWKSEAGYQARESFVNLVRKLRLE